jgi:hypothetical protein
VLDTHAHDEILWFGKLNLLDGRLEAAEKLLAVIVNLLRIAELRPRRNDVGGVNANAVEAGASRVLADDLQISRSILVFVAGIRRPNLRRKLRTSGYPREPSIGPKCSAGRPSWMTPEAESAGIGGLLASGMTIVRPLRAPIIVCGPRERPCSAFDITICPTREFPLRRVGFWRGAKSRRLGIFKGSTQVLILHILMGFQHVGTRSPSGVRVGKGPAAVAAKAVSVFPNILRSTPGAS